MEIRLASTSSLSNSPEQLIQSQLTRQRYVVPAILMIVGDCFCQALSFWSMDAHCSREGGRGYEVAFTRHYRFLQALRTFPGTQHPSKNQDAKNRALHPFCAVLATSDLCPVQDVHVL
jgi:hypothetical protein